MQAEGAFQNPAEGCHRRRASRRPRKANSVKSFSIITAQRDRTMLISTDTPKASAPRMLLWKRQLMIVSRWLHIYLSMASFGTVFFFAVTGLTLNHTEWAASQQKTVQVKGRLDLKVP